LEAWLRSEQTDADEEYDREDEEDESDWLTTRLKMVRPDVSLELYRLCEILDWRHLPWGGALLDQAAWWLHDIAIIDQRKRHLEREVQAVEKARDRVARIQAELAAKKENQ